jgi:hypothetical protein
MPNMSLHGERHFGAGFWPPLLGITAVTLGRRTNTVQAFRNRNLPLFESPICDVQWNFDGLGASRCKKRTTTNRPQHTQDKYAELLDSASLQYRFQWPRDQSGTGIQTHLSLSLSLSLSP